MGSQARLDHMHMCLNDCAVDILLKIFGNDQICEHNCYQEYVEMLFLYLAWCLPTLAALHLYRQLIGHQRLVDAQST